MGALNGYKVLDFSTLLPGPYATMTLADMGAEVLKISGRDKYDLVVNWPPVLPGAEVTGAQAWLGRNKKTIFLNLKKPSAIEVVKKLVMEYDIVVEQFRPGVMAKLGIGYEQLRAINPRLIYCAITGYGQSGPSPCGPATTSTISPVRVSPPPPEEKTAVPASITFRSPMWRAAP